MIKDELKESPYEIYTLHKVDPLLLKGSVIPKNSKTFQVDPSLGTLKTIAVKDQQEVKEGDVLFTYENEEVINQVSQQDNELQKANLSIENIQGKIATEKEKLNKVYYKQNQQQQVLNQIPNDKEHLDEIKEAKSQLDAVTEEINAQQEVIRDLEQSLTSAQLDLNQLNQTYEAAKNKTVTTVTAPFSGLIHLNEEGKTHPETPFIELLSPEILVKGTVTEFNYHLLKPEVPVEVTPLVSKEQINGKIETVSQLPSAGQTSLTEGASQGTTANYTFTASVEKPIQYGFNVEIKLPLEEIRVPKKAVLKENETYYVYKVVDKKAQKTTIIAKENQGYYQVTEGVKEKEEIVKNPDKNLKDGVEISK